MNTLYLIFAFIAYSTVFILFIKLASKIIELVNNYLNQREEKRLLYFKIKTKLEEDLLHHQFSGDWRKSQVANLQLIWLKTIFEVNSRDMCGYKLEQYEILPRLAKISLEDLKFPIKWKLEDRNCFLFSMEILSAFELLQNDRSLKAVPFKSDKILPVPKEFIIKAILYISDYIKNDQSELKRDDRGNLSEKLSFTRVYLDTAFIDTGDDDLPSTLVENSRAAIMRKKQKENIYEDDINLIDWRSESK